MLESLENEFNETEYISKQKDNICVCMCFKKKKHNRNINEVFMRYGAIENQNYYVLLLPNILMQIIYTWNIIIDIS